jgi:MFS family permease
LGHAVLALAVALNAAAAMVLEIAAGRLLAPYFGMSLYTWTTVIGVVLAGLTVGHWIGGRLAGVEGRRLTRRLSAAFWLGALTSALVLPILSILVAGSGLRALPPAPAIALSGFAAFFLPSLLAGLVQPIATKLALEMAGRISGRILGRMLAMGALGSILGTFLAGFVLISFIGSAGTVWLVAATNAALGALFMTRWAGTVALAGTAALAGAIAIGTPGSAALTTPCDHESQYFCIQIDPADETTGRPSRLMALDHLVHSINDRDEPRLLASPYLHLVDEIAKLRFPDGPDSAFFVGGGGFTLPRAWQDRWPAARLTVAEIDPEVSALARAELWLQPGPGMTILERDARVALDLAPGTYDVVFGDAFRDIAIPAHLVTREFHDLVAARLGPRGFYLLNVVDTPGAPRLLSSLVLTLRQSFAAVEAWVVPEDIAGAKRGTFIVYAAQAPSGLPKQLRAAEGYDRFWAQIDLSRLPAEALGLVLSDDFAPVDRLLADLWLYGEE